MAGAVVGVVALPLSMALAIASGVAPQHGLYTAIVGGLVIAMLGGSRVQVSGPTAAFVVILAPIAARAGLGGLLVATLLAGLMLVAMGALGFAPFFGGIAATGAIARTATSVRGGGRTPLAAGFHALVVLLSVLLLAPILSYLPMAALAALLVFVAWNMAEAPHFLRILRTAPRSDVAVLLLCFSLTVVFDMVVSVTVGVVLSALLFMRRMAAVSEVRLVGSTHHALREPLPKSVVIYDIQGPLFFGAAQKAMGALETVEGGVKVVILDLADVPVIDATGLVALESAIARLNDDGVKVILAGVGGQVLHAFARAGWRDRKGRLRIFQSFENAVERAREQVAGSL